MLSTSDAQAVNRMCSPKTLSTDSDYGEYEYFMHLHALSVLNRSTLFARENVAIVAPHWEDLPIVWNQSLQDMEAVQGNSCRGGKSQKSLEN